MNKKLATVIFSVLASGAVFAQTNTENAWVNKKGGYKLLIADKACPESISMGSIEDASSSYNFVKYVEFVKGGKRPPITFIAPKRTIDRSKLFSLTEKNAAGDACISLISTGDMMMRYTSALVDGECTAGTSSEQFVSHIKITKNYSGNALVTVEKVDRFNNISGGGNAGELQEVTTTCYYGE